MFIDIGKYEEGDDMDIIELQGDLENIELIDCKLDRDKVELHFENFFLQGCIKDETYTLLERTYTGGRYVFRKFPAKRKVFFFNKPPRYKFSKKQN